MIGCALKPSELQKCLGRVSNVVFRFACACHGLKTGFPKVRISGLIVWFIVAATSPFTVSLYFLHMTFLSEDQPGLSDVTGAIGAFNFMLSEFAAMFAFIFKHETVERLLQIDVRNGGDVLFPMICSIPFFITCASIINRMDNDAVMIGYANYVGFELSMTVFFMVHSNVSESILAQLKELHELTRKADVSWNHLLLEKLRIREQMALANSIFARPLAFYHIQVFIAVVFDFASIMGHTMHIHEKSLLMASLFAYLIVLAYAARKGSTILSQCVETEFQIWKLVVSRADLRQTGRQSEVIGIFRFREEWDTLQVASLTLTSRNFLVFLSTVVTCVAVVLQFDYKVVRTITGLAQSSL